MYNCGGCGIFCGDAGYCDAGACGCAGLQCGELCVADLCDPHNCGGCGEVCGDADGEGRICSEGVCTSCDALGMQDCGGATCTNVRDDSANCGGCGEACDPGSECVNGNCVAGTCEVDCGFGVEPGGGPIGGGCMEPPVEWTAVCCASAAGSVCADLAYDWSNCGSCGHQCADDQLCDHGDCV